MLSRLPVGNSVRIAIIIAGSLAVFPTAAPCLEKQPTTGKGYLVVEANEAAPGERELVDSFAPTFAAQEIKLSPGPAGRKLLTIAADGGFTSRMVRKYNETLLSRGINIYGAAYYGDFSWERPAFDASITATRKCTTEPDTIEISEGIAMNPTGDQPLMPMTVATDRLSIPLRSDFGKNWKKLRLIPATEPAAPEPKTGRYPGSRVCLVRKDDGLAKTVLYATKGNLAEVEKYFEAKLKEIHKTVIITGDPTSAPAPVELFGIKTSARIIVVAGYTYAQRKLHYTEVTLKQAGDPNLAPYVEIEVAEN